MSYAVVIHSITHDGLVEIKLEIAGPAAALMTVKTWPDQHANPTSKPAKIDAVQLYGALLSPDAKSVACHANVFGPDPDVTCTLIPASQSINVVVKGTLGGFADKNETYALAPEDYANIDGFLAASGFPKS
jgi:hypothetical protein